MTSIDEKVFDRDTPWAACDALDQFLMDGGCCAPDDSINWAGIEFTCARKADGESTDSGDIAQQFAWAHLAIAIKESRASTYPTTDAAWGTIRGAMWVRANMISRFGDHAGDPICDLKTVVQWCLATPDVQNFLASDEPERFRLESMVRGVAEILRFLTNSGRLTATDDVTRILTLIP